ncbi:zinc-alpha-2-glycoprotein [Thomomys bottae]
MVPVLLSLPLLLGTAAPPETPGGAQHALTFLYTGVSKPSKGFPRFQALAFLDDQAFFRYDSESQRAQPLGPWSQVRGMEDWKEESRLQKAREEMFLGTLRDIMDYYRDSEGSHTFQGRFGCEFWSNGSSGAFWSYAYDGEDFITFNKDIPAWVPLEAVALETKKKWEAEKVYVKRAKAYLEEECPGMLRRYLNHSRTQLDRQDPPSVWVTSHVVPRSHRTLKCLAYNFYPQGISLHWKQTPQAQESVWERVLLPSGNGTYQAWVLMRIGLQDTAPRVCSVQHPALPQPLTAQWRGR